MGSKNASVLPDPVGHRMTARLARSGAPGSGLGCGMRASSTLDCTGVGPSKFLFVSRERWCGGTRNRAHAPPSEAKHMSARLLRARADLHGDAKQKATSVATGREPGCEFFSSFHTSGGWGGGHSAIRSPCLAHRSLSLSLSRWRSAPWSHMTLTESLRAHTRHRKQPEPPRRHSGTEATPSALHACSPRAQLRQLLPHITQELLNLQQDLLSQNAHHGAVHTTQTRPPHAPTLGHTRPQ